MLLSAIRLAKALVRRLVASCTGVNTARDLRFSRARRTSDHPPLARPASGSPSRAGLRNCWGARCQPITVPGCASNGQSGGRSISLCWPALLGCGRTGPPSRGHLQGHSLSLLMATFHSKTNMAHSGLLAGALGPAKGLPEHAANCLPNEF